MIMEVLGYKMCLLSKKRKSLWSKDFTSDGCLLTAKHNTF